MATVTKQAEGLTFSLSSLAREFGIARETVAKRLAAANVHPVTTKKNHAVYQIRSAAIAILQIEEQEVVSDPNLMLPKERLDWFKSETERLKYEKETGISVATEDARLEMANIVQLVTKTLDTIPDVLERDCRLPADSVLKVEGVIDSLRLQMAEDLER